jgi:radical SAM protein with 4Fe4S-binding SPASM domain
MEKCAHVYTVYPDGKVTTCDEFESSLRDVNLNIHKSNDVWVTEDSFKSISSTARLHLEKCVSCSHKRTCGGGCIATRDRYYGSKYYEEYCSYKKNLIDFVSCKLEDN